MLSLEWLREQSSDFKNRLTDLYNRTFNCYVPEVRRTHQEFPSTLDLKGLGIDNLYDSQKDVSRRHDGRRKGAAGPTRKTPRANP